MARAAKDAERREQESLLPTNVTELVPVTYEITPWKALHGVRAEDAQRYIDEHWTPHLIQFFEEQMQAYTKAGNLDAALNVAMTMAGMTSTLSPARLRRQAEKALDKYGAVEPDLSHLTDEQLAMLRGEPFSAPAATAPKPSGDPERGPADEERGPDDLNDGRAPRRRRTSGISNRPCPLAMAVSPSALATTGLQEGLQLRRSSAAMMPPH
jgi:hypothetical protein